MQEERLKILKMLEEGKINTTEAMSLLEHFKDDDEANQATPNTKKTNKLGDFINSISSGDFNFNSLFNLEDLSFGLFKQDTVVCVSEPIEGAISNIHLVGKNGKLKIDTHDEAHIQVNCSFISRKSDDKVELVQNENGTYELKYDDDSIKTLSIHCFLPKVDIHKLCAKNTNSSITVSHLSTLSEGIFKTSNSGILVHDVVSENLNCSTSNASIKLSHTTAKQLVVQTSNAKIVVDHCLSNRTNLITSNAPIEFMVSDDTTASDNLSLTANTSNAGIRVTLPPVLDDTTSVTVKHATSAGKFISTVPYLQYMDYDTHASVNSAATKHINLALTTSNANIKVS